MQRVAERMRALGAGHPDREAHLRGESPWLDSAKLKLVDGCNLRCFMCDYWRGRREDELTTDEVRAVLDDLAALGCRKVHLTGGELFLRKDVVELAAHSTALGLRVNLTTNGTRLDKDTLRALLKLPVRSITLSVDSPVPHVHDAIRGRQGALKATLKTLDRLLAKRGPKTRVRLNTVVHRDNLETLVEMPRLLRERAAPGRPRHPQHTIDGWLLIPMDPWNEASKRAALGAEDIAFYQAHVAPILAETVHVPGFDPWIFGRDPAAFAEAARGFWALGHYRARRCHVPWFHTLVDARGDVYPCCGGHTRLPKLGNVREASLRRIWQGPAYSRFRQQMLRERTAVCHRCDDFLAENRAYDALLDEWGDTR